MARRGKTKLGGVDTRAMLEAGKAQKGVTRAEERTGAFHERKGAVARQGAAATDKAIQYDVEQRKEGERYDAQQVQQAEETAFKQSMSERQQGLQEQEFKAGLADKGLQPKDQGAERAGSVEQEMEKGATQPPLMAGPTPDQQRMATQGKKPLEMPTARGGYQGDYEFTEGRKAAEQQKRATTQLTQAANLMRARTAYQKALFAQDKESLEQAKSQLMGPINNLNAKLENIIGAAGDVSKLGTINWGDLAEYSDNTNVAAEIEKKGVGGVSNIVRLLRNKMTHKGMEYIAGTGLLPENDLWDPTTAKGQEFDAEVNAEAIRSQTLGTNVGIRTLAEKMRQLRQKAAAKIMQADLEAVTGGPVGGEGQQPLPPTMGIPEGEPQPIFDPEWKETTPKEDASGRPVSGDVRTTSPREQQRAEQIGLTNEPRPPETSDLRGRWEREREEQRAERKQRRAERSK